MAMTERNAADSFGGSSSRPINTIDQLGLADRRRLTGPGLRSFWKLASLWTLSEHEQMTLLGIRSRSTLRSWRKGQVQVLRRDTLERLSLMFGIYRALHELFGEPELADTWLRRPNSAPLFRGESALAHILSGRVEDLYDTRRYLDAVLHG